MAAARFMPGVCAVLASSSEPFTTRTPCRRQSVLSLMAFSVTCSRRAPPLAAHGLLRQTLGACFCHRRGVAETRERPHRHGADQRRGIGEMRRHGGDELALAAV